VFIHSKLAGSAIARFIRRDTLAVSRAQQIAAVQLQPVKVVESHGKSGLRPVMHSTTPIIF
uniref:hypothetical protein n=1 Tax=Klebsiella pneumoniae TaxID=573 RepID=UPI001954C466